jgi:hypothetical protein
VDTDDDSPGRADGVLTLRLACPFVAAHYRVRVDGSMAVTRAVHAPLAGDTRRLVVAGALARLVALTALAGLAAVTWPLAEPRLKAGLTVVAVTVVLVLVCALRSIWTVRGFDLVAILASWLTAWLSVYLFMANGILTYGFATEGAQIVCHDLLCPAGPDLLYVCVFGAGAMAALVDVVCSLTAMLSAVRRASTVAGRMTAIAGSIIGGALILAAAGVWAFTLVG